MPYAFAHPAAVVALPRLLGGLAVPSALVIGSVIPDAWYFAPFLAREDSHSLAGMLLFCLPAGLLAYAAFHLVLKQPLLALLPLALGARLQRWACPAFPAAPWRAVVASLGAGTLTHYAWDALTHPGPVAAALHLEHIVLLGAYQLKLHQILQHASTLLGSAFLACWLWPRLRSAPRSLDGTRTMAPAARRAIHAVLVLVPLGAFCGVLLAVSPAADLHFSGMRSLLRAAGITAVSALGLAFLAYCVWWRVIFSRGAASRRASRAPASTSAS